MATSAVATAIALTSVLTAQQVQRITAPTAVWSGWAECVLEVKRADYSNREAHRWTITGRPTLQSNVEVYPTTWTVTGEGASQVVGGTQMSSAQWKVNVAGMPGTMGFTLHPDRIAVQKVNAQLVGRGAITGQQTITRGTPQSTSIVLDLGETRFPRIEDGTASTRIVGSSSTPFDGASAPLAPAGTPGTANCRWEFTRGAPNQIDTSSARTTSTTTNTLPPPQPAPPPATTATPPPAITITQPRAGEVWAVGTGHEIRFTNTTRSGFHVLVSIDGGATFQSLRTESGIGLFREPTSDAGEVHWTVSGPPTNRALVQVMSVGNPAIIQTVEFATAQPALRITQPAAGETWAIGTQHKIAWTHNLGSVSSAWVYVSTDNGATYSTLTDGPVPTNEWTWTVAAKSPGRGRIVVYGNESGLTVSHGVDFTVGP